MLFFRLLLIVFSCVAAFSFVEPADSIAASDILTVSGVINDAQKKPIRP
jgi:hypothetical protein